MVSDSLISPRLSRVDAARTVSHYLAGDLSVATIGKHDSRLPVAPFLAPLAQRQECWQQPLSLRSQRIDHLASVSRIESPFEDAASDHARQPVRKDVARDSKAGLEL